MGETPQPLRRAPHEPPLGVDPVAHPLHRIPRPGRIGPTPHRARAARLQDGLAHLRARPVLRLGGVEKPLALRLR